MRRLKFETGGRPRHNDDLQLLQDNIYQAAEAFFQGNGAFILSGCTVTGNDISSGVVFCDGKIKPFAGVTGVSFPCYIKSAAAVDAVSLPHETGGSKPTQTHLLAEHSASQPGSGEFITVTSTGGRTWFDAVSSELVRTKGNQTITGVKTFNSIPKVGSSNLLRVADIINNLTSDATDKALSAAMGKAIMGTGVPGTLNSLRKLAAAIADDPNFAAGVATELGKRIDRNGDVMQGVLSMGGNKLTNLSPGTNNLDAVNKQQLDSKANKSLLNNWTDIPLGPDADHLNNNHGAQWGSMYKAQYCKDSFGFVHLRGAIFTHSPSGLGGTLPSGFRPNARIFPRGVFASGGTFMYYQIETNGNILFPESSGGGEDIALVLDGVSFYVGID